VSAFLFRIEVSIIYYLSHIQGAVEKEEGTYLKVFIPKEHIVDKIIRYKVGNIIKAEIRIDDGRRITNEQRKKIFATIKDIALFTGDHPEDLRAWLLYDYCISTGEIPFSLSNCSISTAREFINFIIDFILKENIPISDMALNRTDDIDRYLWGCIKYKKCAICGKQGETHHWDAIGMGNDRETLDDSNLRKIQLCREHHTEAHAIGRNTFGSKYHIYGILYKEE
jgi:hypothetical protein